MLLTLGTRNISRSSNIERSSNIGLLGRGQSLEDKLNAIKFIISGQGLSYVILKATTSELIGPKKKHLNYLTSITHEPNVSIPNMVKYLMQRARNQEWSVVFKSLMTIHYLISYGNEKFIQNLASSTENQRAFDYLTTFSDRSSNQAYDMSTFIRRYARYLTAKICSYKSLGIDFCRTPKALLNNSSLLSSSSSSSSELITKTITTTNTSSTNGLIITTSQEPIIKPKSTNSSTIKELSPLKMKTMQSEQLLTTLPILQNLFDLLVAFDASVKDLNNGIINSVFSMLYKDFVKLYIAYQTAIIRLLELYSKCKQLKQAYEMLEAYKKFLVRMDKVSDFMFVVDSVGMDKSDMPNVSRSPNISLKILEKHLENLTTYSSLRRLSSIQSPLQSNSNVNYNNSTNQTSLLLTKMGQSVELTPKIDYDYNIYGNRRRSLRRNNSTNKYSNTTNNTPIKAIDSGDGNYKSTLTKYEDFSRHYSTIEDILGEEEDKVDLISDEIIKSTTTTNNNSSCLNSNSGYDSVIKDNLNNNIVDINT